MKQIWLFLVFFAPFMTSHGQEMTAEQQLAELANISNEASVFGKVREIFAHDEKKLSGCVDAGIPRPEGITAFENPIFQGGKLQAAEWQVRYRVSVCGKQRLRTALFTIANYEELSITSLLPGSTQADMSLQADVRNSFFMGTAKLAPECKTPQITHTQVTQKPTSTKSAWQEIWTADFCGKTVAQTIDFYPNEKGTAFTMTALR